MNNFESGKDKPDTGGGGQVDHFNVGEFLEKLKTRPGEYVDNIKQLKEIQAPLMEIYSLANNIHKNRRQFNKLSKLDILHGKTKEAYELVKAINDDIKRLNEAVSKISKSGLRFGNKFMGPHLERLQKFIDSQSSIFSYLFAILGSVTEYFDSNSYLKELNNEANDLAINVQTLKLNLTMMVDPSCKKYSNNHVLNKIIKLNNLYVSGRAKYEGVEDTYEDAKWWYDLGKSVFSFVDRIL